MPVVCAEGGMFRSQRERVGTSSKRTGIQVIVCAEGGMFQSQRERAGTSRLVSALAFR